MEGNITIYVVAGVLALIYTTILVRNRTRNKTRRDRKFMDGRRFRRK